jgi:hypothetical protein
MKKTLITILALAAVLALVAGPVSAKDTKEEIKDLKKRLQQLELKSNKSKILWSGDLRVEAHHITGETAESYDGLALQNVMVNALWYHATTGNLPVDGTGQFDYNAVLGAIGANAGDYMAWTQMLQFPEIPSLMGAMLVDAATAMNMDPSDPAVMAQLQQAFMTQMLAVNGLQPAQKIDNDILYTTRLRLDMNAEVSKNVSFAGRLSMYKPWGSSTQVGLFNGQPSAMSVDANWPGVPGDATLKVDRAYFNWNNIAGQPMYLSLGRRPSTGGPPLHFRHDESRAGTPMGTIIDMQFDGATFGYHLGDHTALRACYGLGYESQYGNGTLGQDLSTVLKDASFFGFNIDAWDTPELQVQTTVARAFNLTDGFNGFVIMPNNPVTGQPMPGQIVTRYSPSVNLGQFDLASLLVAGKSGPFDWFVTGSWSKSRPDDPTVTTPFGGFLSDPFEVAEEHTGSMYYLGARYNFNQDKTKVGLEWNKGSQYWFNFAPAQDDIIAAKTSTRGTVWEGYVTHRITRKFVARLAYITYDYDYSGSGWHLGAPKDLDSDPVLGFPTYKKAHKLSLGFSARF